MTTALSLSTIPYSKPVVTKSLPGGVQTALNETALSALEAKRLEKACAEFESLFINLVMKQMRKSVMKSGLIDGGLGEEFFTGMLDEEISRQAAIQQGVGLKDVLIAQLTGGRRKPVVAKSVALRSYSTQKAAKKALPSFTFPVSGTVSSPFGKRRDPFTGEGGFHHGIDIASSAGSEIFAAAEGRVVFSGWKQGYGNVVTIDHSNGYSTLYAHNEKNLVEVGEEVTADQLIAHVGSTGRSTGPHLHYEVRKNGKAINPEKVTCFSERGWYAKSL
jgi:murein DD-endopeptidase MepM/ murein hydrolase activator NlpD